MLKIMASKVKDIEIDLFEFQSKNKINYSIDIIKYLLNKYEKVSLYMVVGEDLLFSLKKWKQWNDIKRLVTIVYIGRPGYNYIESKNNKNFLMINDLEMNISSSLIKEKIMSNNKNKFLDVDSMLDKDVLKYILK